MNAYRTFLLGLFVVFLTSFTTIALAQEPGHRIPLYEEPIEGIYRNFWKAVPLVTREEVKSLGQAELTIIGEGKTVNFYGVLSINCSNGKYFWEVAANGGTAIAKEKDINNLVPRPATDKAIEQFCPSN